MTSQWFRTHSASPALYVALFEQDDEGQRRDVLKLGISGAAGTRVETHVRGRDNPWGVRMRRCVVWFRFPFDSPREARASESALRYAALRCCPHVHRHESPRRPSIPLLGYAEDKPSGEWLFVCGAAEPARQLLYAYSRIASLAQRPDLQIAPYLRGAA